MPSTLNRTDDESLLSTLDDAWCLQKNLYDITEQ